METGGQVPLPFLDHLLGDVDHVVEHVAHLRSAERWHQQTVYKADEYVFDYKTPTARYIRAMPQFSSPG